MELTVDQNALSRALRLISRVAATRPTLPILQTVLLEAHAGRLQLTVTDAALALTTAVPADVTTSGRTALPARLLGDYVANLPPEPLRMTLNPEQHRGRVACGRFDAGLATADPDDFPALPAMHEPSAVDLEAARLRRAIERVAFAAARDESRPVLSTVLFDFRDDGLTLAAADGFRLGRTRLPEAASTPQRLLVPARAVVELGRLLADAERVRLLLTPDGRGVRFVVGESALYTRLIEGQFPDIERVIPRACTTQVTVESTALHRAVRVAGLFGGGEARAVVLEAANGRLQLHARGDETGEAEGELPATLVGESQAVALNTRLFTEVLDAVTEPTLVLGWSSPQTPVLVREASGAAPDDLWLLMPLHDPSLTRRVPPPLPPETAEDASAA
jgi:DNA polymerase-3 subunit beta